LARQEIAIKFIVLITEEHALAPVAALRDMMGKAGDDKAGDADHGSTKGSKMPQSIGLI
jgi:hypothetical protein